MVSFGANRPLYDLHSHTTASDGKLPPRELVRLATEQGLTALAVTDHDTVDGLAEAEAEAEALGLEIVPGIEVSANFGEHSVHVLGLFIRHREPWLVEFFAEARERRVDRVHQIVAKLAREGVHIDARDVLARSQHGTVGRPHVAEVLVERGHVPTFSEAFDRYLGQKAPAFVGYEKVTFLEACELIQRAGGVAVLAHPVLLEDDSLIPTMVDQKLQGLEVFHRDHSPQHAAGYLELAERFDLLVSGGSDYHKPDAEGASRLGCRELTEGAFERLRAAAGG